MDIYCAANLIDRVYVYALLLHVFSTGKKRLKASSNAPN